MPVAKRMFYPEKTPVFFANDGDEFPTTQIGVGTRLIQYPARRSFIYTGEQWELEETTQDSILAELQEMRKENRAMVELVKALLNKL